MADRGGPPAFGHLLKLHRVTRGLTQEALAERSGLSTRAVSDLERGVNRRLHRETLRLLPDALSLSAADRAALTVTAQGQRESSFELLRGRKPTARAEREDDVPPMLGWRGEFALLGHHLQGEGPPILFFGGPPLSGKSHLLREAMCDAVGFGLRVLEGRCYRNTRSLYGPLLDALLGYIRSQPPEQVRTDPSGCDWMASLLPELADGMVEPPPWTMSDD